MIARRLLMGRRGSKIRLEVRQSKLGVSSILYFNEKGATIMLPYSLMRYSSMRYIIPRCNKRIRDRQDEEPRCGSSLARRDVRHWHWTSTQWWMEDGRRRVIIGSSFVVRWMRMRGTLGIENAIFIVERVARCVRFDGSRGWCVLCAARGSFAGRWQRAIGQRSCYPIAMVSISRRFILVAIIILPWFCSWFGAGCAMRGAGEGRAREEGGKET